MADTPSDKPADRRRNGPRSISITRPINASIRCACSGDPDGHPIPLTAPGRDTESQVLARAIEWHSEHRVLINGHKTVIFNQRPNPQRMPKRVVVEAED